MASSRTRAKSPLDHDPDAVQYARNKSGLSKTQLAERLGVSISLISEIEAGTRNCTPAMQIDMARVLNCPVVVLESKRHAAPGAQPTAKATP